MRITKFEDGKAVLSSSTLSGLRTGEGKIFYKKGVKGVTRTGYMEVDV